MAQESFVKPNDYSCYIHVHNKTSVDLSLFDSTAEHGKWASGSPANTIEPNTKAIIELNDKFGTTGSQGKVAYQLYLPKNPDAKITFGIEFCDPYGPWYDNYCHANTQFPSVLSLKVLDYNSNGHPFTAHVEVYAVGSTDLNSAKGQAMINEAMKSPAGIASLSHQSNDNYHANFDIGFQAGPFVDKKPVHESIAIAALIASRMHLAPGANYNNLNKDQWEFVRGLIWNDDPSCLLFDDREDNNRDFGVGGEWYAAFKGGDDNCMTRRSHFGNLQFLHSMANHNHQDPQTTKASLMAWLEVMYKLACGNQGVSLNDTLGQRFPGSFSDSSDPAASSTLRDLLLGTTRSYKWPKLDRRALGICLHIIQDSYAVGHTLRRLLNANDIEGRDEQGYIRFKSNTYAKLGPIITFHTYAGQSKRHGHYDEYAGSADSLVPKNLNTFNSIIGARDAIEMNRQLINFYFAKTKWEDGVSDFLSNTVFALDKNATASNADVDENFGKSATSASNAAYQARYEDEEYRTGLERKLNQLEAGFVRNEFVLQEEGLVRRWVGVLPGKLYNAARYILAAVAFFVMFLLSHFVMQALKLN